MPKAITILRNNSIIPTCRWPGLASRGGNFEDPATKAQMKAMAARALWQLAKGNVTVCRTITESRALLCFAVLLEKGHDEVQSYSAMALMEITAVAEQNSDLRRSSFKPTSPAARAVVDQLLKLVEKADSDLLIPCIQAIGNLARTFRATETRMIGPLAIITEGGAKHLIQLVYFGEQVIQTPSLILLCYISLHCPDSEVLANEEVLIVLEWSTKQAHLLQEPEIESLLPEAKSRLELHQNPHNTLIPERTTYRVTIIAAAIFKDHRLRCSASAIAIAMGQPCLEHMRP
ncbi:ARMADILLO REPEAT ONLY 4 [Salix viminalis]|uniref:ARMADILLO REPEAT ONLY 4 n=1 Tax=Salix viminalis TaxID=40686 RepID=A0A9Q0QK35_SALVM|nr:ARMADILLO REPEAT ONLY 4 [Salix viminalis]